MTVATDHIRGRLVEIEVGEVAGQGWVAVGVIRVGLPHERGQRFEARALDPEEAETRLRAEIEAYLE